MIIVVAVLLVLAGLPTIMTIINMAALGVPEPAPAGTQVAILIPARDEAAGIANCVERALASTGVTLEVIVLDDHSTDATAAIVEKLAFANARLRIASAPPLPVGWTGKVHACHLLARLTEARILIFIDADVSLRSDAAARLAGALMNMDLVSGVPQQRMESFAELLIIPMINMLLLGYLPILMARRDPRPALAAACGQMIAVRAEAYALAGGHAAIRASLHDGLALPRRFREAGLHTDLVLGASLASCRMYTGWGTAVSGTLKNATEGLARPLALPIWTILLLGAHVLPWVALAYALALSSPVAMALSIMACIGPVAARFVQAIWCREPLRSVPLNPFSVALLVALQWLALGRKWAGRKESWRGRSYPAKIDNDAARRSLDASLHGDQSVGDLKQSSFGRK